MEPTVWIVGKRFWGWRLDRFVSYHIPKLSRTYIQTLIGQRIVVDWTQKVTPSTRVRVGSKVFALYPNLLEEPNAFLDIPVLFEDEKILAVDKPPGLVVHPTNQCRENSLIVILRKKYPQQDLTLLHRLDRETSGVLLLAKTREVAREFGFAMMAKQFQKIYIARVLGIPKLEKGEVSAPIGKHPSSQVFVRRAVREDGQTAITRYRVIQKEKETSLLELQPLTGRTHQLRVHMEFLGCPIVGDVLYGKPDEFYHQIVRGEAQAPRLHLHAQSIEGKIGNRLLKISSPLPF